MADKKISALTALATPADDDVLPIVDVSATETKKITWLNLVMRVTDWVTANFQAALGYTAEDVANKQSNLTASATKYPTVNAVNTGLGTKEASLGFTPENSANKKTTLADNSDTFYPSQKAVKTAVDAKQNLGVDYILNYLANAGFWFAQRQVAGTLTTITDEAYSADRFRIGTENGSLQYQRIDTNGARETGLQSRYYGAFKKITNAGKFSICQPVEGSLSYDLAGRTVTFQIKLKASAAKNIRIGLLQLSSSGAMDTIPADIVPTWNGNSTDPTFGTNLTLLAPASIPAGGANGAIVGNAVTGAVTTSWQLFGGTFALTNTTKNVIPIIFTDAQFSANDILYLAEAGLYLGDYVNPWQPMAMGQELLKVLRFYQKSYGLDIAPGTAASAGYLNSVVPSNTVNIAQIYNSIILPVSMRIAPSVTAYGYGGGASVVSNASGTDLAANSGATLSSGPSSFTIFNNNGGTVTTTGFCVIVHYIASAEL